ncbi:MAG: nucleotide exchange factor GrpE [Candidatus Blackburnbacteria bacterium RIFCSPHIGHO2_01_FULL_43_15b]|uniref:Protein GrpE n=1 Tax=Candidatus Blackburnbacteria bacterium RIFCSPHIGHO2_01_FULL_43_15b TaxID=1797513 RepID=A0A1G1V3G7_9BACT|nr:MAG: nucleotide exchange factor GrpE [Candidatus Blackburnbacteria bacterium RIFCSPHIGHO2_01_FULL_43_15b]
MKENKTKSAKQKTKAEKEFDKQDEALARVLADYQNLVKRVDRERVEIYTRASKNIIEELVPVVDLLRRAQSHLQDTGLEMALEQFRQVLERHGIEDVEAKEGMTFDASIHEAVETVEGGRAGTVAQVAQAGYKWKDGMVLRPAKVTVYK